MTVSVKVRSTLATLEGICADFRAMYSESSDENTKKFFGKLAEQTDEVMSKLKNRVEQLETEEPQYREEK
ncbi:MAG: DUF1657 domain-containing protein [Caulobacteraceae bacterium]